MPVRRPLRLALAALLTVVLLGGALSAGWYAGERWRLSAAARPEAVPGTGWPDTGLPAEGDTLGGAYRQLLAMEVER